MPPAQLWLSRFAKLTVLFTFALLFLGAQVTSLDAGMSVPDWPNTFGYNMWTFPFARWVGLVFWEHTHRVVASVLGLLVIALAVWAFRTETRKWVRWLTYLAVVLVTVQGIMGGLRVTKNSISLAVVHGVTAQLFFCLLILIAAALSPAWNRPLLSPAAAPKVAHLKRWAWVMVVFLIIQLILGAVMRHNGAGLAMPYFPFDDEGHFMPRVHNMMVDIHFTHRVWAFVVTGVALVLGIKGLKAAGGDSRIVLPSVAIMALVLFQIFLGAKIIWTGRAEIPTSLHVINGALILGFSFILLVRSSYYASLEARSNPTASDSPSV